MRRFQLQRDIDTSGVSGTGIVAEGVEFADKECVLHWLSSHPCIAIYPNIEELYTIHGHGGNTKVVWLDDSKGKTLKNKLRGEVISITRKKAVGHG